MKKESPARMPEQASSAVAHAAAPGSGQAEGFLESLGLYGLSHLDAAVLAALAAETPMLLIGPHGVTPIPPFDPVNAAHRHHRRSCLTKTLRCH